MAVETEVEVGSSWPHDSLGCQPLSPTSLRYGHVVVEFGVDGIPSWSHGLLASHLSLGGDGEVEVDEEGMAEMLMDDNAIATVARPGTSLKKPGTGAGGPSQAFRY